MGVAAKPAGQGLASFPCWGGGGGGAAGWDGQANRKKTSVGFHCALDE